MAAPVPRGKARSVYFLAFRQKGAQRDLEDGMAHVLAGAEWRGWRTGQGAISRRAKWARSGPSVKGLLQ